MTPEIRAFEFALGLFAVLIGLAIAALPQAFIASSAARRPWSGIRSLCWRLPLRSVWRLECGLICGEYGSP